MDTGKRGFLIAGLGVGVGLAAATTQAQEAGVGGSDSSPPAAMDRLHYNFGGSGKQTTMVDANYRPRRVNKAIELWEDGHVVNYTGYTPTGRGEGYEMGRAMAKTWCDAVYYEGEHGVFDISNLQNFVRGLVDGGPTRSGHRTPMIFVSLPVTGLDEASMRANGWMLQQVLATGVHGIDLCHARDPGAIEAAVAAMRYPFDYPGVPKQRLEGLRGEGSAAFAAQVWGVARSRYVHIADLWPLNPRGEIVLGTKIEDRHAHANVDRTLAVPGVCFAEWGPGDSIMSIVGLSAYPDETPALADAKVSHPLDPRLEAARLTVLAACKAHKVKAVNMSRNRDPIVAFREGDEFMGVKDEQAVLALREYTRRTMPI